MSGESLYGKCQFCGKEAALNIRYYHYTIKCECCHSSDKHGHFERIEYCDACVRHAHPPKHIKVHLYGSEYIKEDGNVSESH